MRRRAGDISVVALDFADGHRRHVYAVANGQSFDFQSNGLLDRDSSGVGVVAMVGMAGLAFVFGAARELEVLGIDRSRALARRGLAHHRLKRHPPEIPTRASSLHPPLQTRQERCRAMSTFTALLYVYPPLI